MESGSLKVAFLLGRDDASTRRCVEAVCKIPGVKPVGILLDIAVPSFKQRLKNQKRNFKDNGWSYPIFKALETLEGVTGSAVKNACVSHSEVLNVLRKAFPDECFSLDELGVKYGIAIYRVENLNGADAITTLGECNADLGVVLGTRILKPGIFSVPKMGCINLHKGKVPEYRGMPPGFWELYDGVSSAGVTVHFVDKGLDTGDIVATGDVPILKTETPESIREKLNDEGIRLIISAISSLRDGSAVRHPQEKLSIKARTRPTRNELAMLQKRLPHWRRHGEIPSIAKNLYILFVYYSGLYSLVRQYRKLRGRSRGAIFLHHRVNDYSKDVLTMDTETFTARLLGIAKRYPISTTAALVEGVRAKKKIQPTTVAIHFDDCYQDILTNGAPVLRALDIPACAFVNSGYVGTSRTFPHDESKYPFVFPMLRSSDLQTWANLGLEVGAHTVNHVDLGTCAREMYDAEIFACGQSLSSTIAKPVEFFSFPFGRLHNINDSARSAVANAGYNSLFSAHGGFIGPRTDPYDIPRLGASYEFSTVHCLLQIEGLAPGQIAEALKGIGRSLSGKPDVAVSEKNASPAVG